METSCTWEWLGDEWFKLADTCVDPQACGEPGQPGLFIGQRVETGCMIP